MATSEEYSVQKAFDRDLDLVDKLLRTYRDGGLLHRQIEGIVGDARGLVDVRNALDELSRALEEADRYARGHITQEDTGIDRMRHLAGLHKG